MSNKRRKGESIKMNSTIYEDYKQTLIDNIIERKEKELNKKRISQLEIILGEIGEKR